MATQIIFVKAISLSVVLLVSVSGCSSLAVHDMIAITPDLRSLKHLNSTRSLKHLNSTEGNCLKLTLATNKQRDECHFNIYFDLLKVDPSSYRPSSSLASASTFKVDNDYVINIEEAIKADMVYGSSITNQLILSPVVQKMSDYVGSLGINPRLDFSVTRRTTTAASGKPYAPQEISVRELVAFGRLLTENLDVLLIELEEKKAGVSRLSFTQKDEKKADFGDVLFFYLKAYASGKFIDRLGNNISKPELSLSGISDDDIQGIATVFLEAFFDSWFESAPMFYEVNNKVEPEYCALDFIEDDLTKPCKNTLSDNLKLRKFYRKYYDTYITNGSGKPTAAEFKESRLVDDQVTKEDVENFQQISKLAGKMSRSLTGLGFGFLNNVNVSFIIGADFAVGDNKTLMHLAQTLAEVSSRRVAEYGAWKKKLADPKLDLTDR